MSLAKKAVKTTESP